MGLLFYGFYKMRVLISDGFLRKIVKSFLQKLIESVFHLFLGQSRGPVTLY